jgi:cytochrome c-type biogenesis protein CcmH
VPAAAGAVAGTIVLDPRLRERPQPQDVLFVVARDASRRIVAVRRADGVRFPFAFTISGSDAMTEGTTFAGPLEVTARLSRSGDAIPAAGDLEGVARGVHVGARDVKVSLDTVRK